MPAQPTITLAEALATLSETLLSLQNEITYDYTNTDYEFQDGLWNVMAVLQSGSDKTFKLFDPATHVVGRKLYVRADFDFIGMANVVDHNDSTVLLRSSLGAFATAYPGSTLVCEIVENAAGNGKLWGITGLVA